MLTRRSTAVLDGHVVQRVVRTTGAIIRSLVVGRSVAGELDVHRRRASQWRDLLGLTL
jgi:hypothetical protein